MPPSSPGMFSPDICSPSPENRISVKHLPSNSMFTDRFHVYWPSLQSRLQFLTGVDQRSLILALNWYSCTVSAGFKEAVSGVCKVRALGYICLFSQLHFIVPAGGLPQDAWTSVVKNAFTCLSGGGLLEVSRSPTSMTTIRTFLCYFMLASHLITLTEKFSEVGIKLVLMELWLSKGSLFSSWY